VIMDEEAQLKLALELSKEEDRRRTQVPNIDDDFKTAVKLQEEEIRRQASPPNINRKSPLSRVTDALLNTFTSPTRVCESCGRRVYGTGLLVNGSLYHPECHRKFVHEKCYVCHEPLPSRGNRISWCEHPFWKEKFCHFHNNDGTPRCASCERLKPIGSRWVILSDGREICSDCSRTMIIDTNYCQPLYVDVLELYRSLQLELPSQPPLMLVDRQALNERSSGQGHGGGPQTRGMTLAEEYRTIRTMVHNRGPFFGQLGNSYPFEHRECRVTAILILFGLPRLLTGSILAHECMHAYLKLSNKTELTPTVEEGLCQLMAYLWIEQQQPEDPFERRLASFIANQIRMHPSPVYGDGFRMALSSFQCYGLPNLINHVKLTGLFPEPH